MASATSSLLKNNNSEIREPKPFQLAYMPLNTGPTRSSGLLNFIVPIFFAIAL